METGEFYNFAVPDQRARKIDSRETFKMTIHFPPSVVLAPTLTICKAKIPKAMWRRWKRHCPACGVKRHPIEGNDDWLEHIAECSEKHVTSER